MGAFGIADGAGYSYFRRRRRVFLPHFDPRTPHADFDPTYSIARSSTFLLRGAHDKNAN